jgi:hypothetical protein
MDLIGRLRSEKLWLGNFFEIAGNPNPKKKKERRECAGERGDGVRGGRRGEKKMIR